MKKCCVKYRVLELEPGSYAMTVRYYTDRVGEEQLAVHDGYGNVRRRADGTPERCRTDFTFNLRPGMSEAEVHQLLSQGAPSEWFDLQEAVLDPDVDTSMKEFAGLVGKEFEVARPEDVRPVRQVKVSAPPPDDFPTDYKVDRQ